MCRMGLSWRKTKATPADAGRLAEAVYAGTVGEKGRAARALEMLGFH